MDEQALHPVATHLIDAYLATWDYRQAFLDQYRHPPTLAARVHHMRAIAMAKLQRDERYELDGDYAEYGRVQFADREARLVYLLRSHSAVAIEHSKSQGRLFDVLPYLKSDVVMLVYEFQSSGLYLSVAGTRRTRGRKRLEASGPPTFVANWPFTPSEAQAFEQAEADPFADLGDLGLDEDESGGQ